MKNITYAVVQSHTSPIVVANFTTYAEAYRFCQGDMDYRIFPTKTPLDLGSVITKADRVERW